MAETPKLVSSMGRAELDRIFVRGYDLNEELMGKISFAQMVYLMLVGRMPSAEEGRMIDTMLIVLVDHGMTTGASQAAALGRNFVACVSTGNTSASMAAYAARAGMKAFVFIPSGQIALGKLSQALDYGAVVLQIEGDFDDAMRLVREVADDSPLYLLNSVNPFRLEGQKTIAFEMMQQRGWRAPDRVVAPGGNLGNSSAIAKGFHELMERGVIAKMPKITIIQAEGANPLYRTWVQYRDREGADGLTLEPVAGASTLATAIKIGNPVSWPKAMRGLRWSAGEVEQVTEQEIADAKAVIGRDGIGCEPASAVTLAGIKKMIAAGGVKPDEDIVAILTGHVLKDPDYTVNNPRHKGLVIKMLDVQAHLNRLRGEGR